MEILEPTGQTAPRIAYNWDLWLVFDGRPRLLERGHDFTEEARAFKRKLITEAALRGYDITAKVKQGGRVLFQVCSPSQEIPVLPELPDARRKYPWATWFDGTEHEIVKGRDFDTSPDTFKQHVYKQAERAGLKVRVTWPLADVCTIQTYKPEDPK